MQSSLGGAVAVVPPRGALRDNLLGRHPHELPHPHPLRQVTRAPAATTPEMTATTQIEEAHSTTNHLTGSHGNPSQSQSQSSQSTVSEADSTMETDKRSIYRHPLFPLMALLFEKCEQATQTPECPSADSFDVDIQAFVQHQERDRKPFFSEDPELDGLMVKAIQVLRIHLLELEKVGELCKDFCNRYISCLKGKLQSEHLLRTEMGLGPEFDSVGSLSPTGGAPVCSVPAGNTGTSQSGGLVATAVGSNGMVLPGNGTQVSGASMTTLGQGQVVSGNTVYQMIQTPQGLVAQPIQLQQSASSQMPVSSAHQPQSATQSSVVHGSTPLSQIGMPSTPDPTTPHQLSPGSLQIPAAVDIGDIDDLGKKNKRGVLPKSATQVMKSWLFQHIVHPYPTEDEKRQIATQTNLTLLQVNNWFINARRRILQPMLDASNPVGPKAKKNKAQQSRPVQRFWPETLANLPTQQGAVSSQQSPRSSQSPTSTTSSPLHSPLGGVTSPESSRASEGGYTTTGIANSQTQGHVMGGVITTTTGLPFHNPATSQLLLSTGIAMMTDGRIVSALDHGGLSLMTSPDSLTSAASFLPVFGATLPTGMTASGVTSSAADSAAYALQHQQGMRHAALVQRDEVSSDMLDSSAESSD